MLAATEGVLKRAHAPSALGSGAGEMYGVINWYHDSTSIGNHHDASPLYDAIEFPATIITLSVEADGMLVIAPQSNGCVTPENNSLRKLADRPPLLPVSLSLPLSSSLSLCVLVLSDLSFLFMCPFLIPRGRLALALQAEGQDLGVHRQWPG